MVSGSGGSWKIVRNNRLYGPQGRYLPPVFSHDFLVHNQADVAAVIAFLILVASIVQTNGSWASKFVSLNYNLPVNSSGGYAGILGSYYTWGPSDIMTVLFYSMIWILFHVLLQDNTVERLQRVLNLSRTKQAKLTESAQLSAFFIISVLWSLCIVLYEGHLTSISKLWEDYPQPLSFGSKFFYIAQFAYWTHCILEFYLQMYKKEEIKRQLQFIIPYMMYIGAAYILSFTRLMTLLLLLHYAAESAFHTARLLHYCAVSGIASVLFTLWKMFFILARLGTITLSVLTLWYGLAQTSVDGIDIRTRNFNTQTIRLLSLGAVFIIQAYIMWQFIKFHLHRAHQRAAEVRDALRATNDLAAAATAANSRQSAAGRHLVNADNRERQQKSSKKKKGNKGGERRNSSTESGLSTGTHESLGSVRQRKTSSHAKS